jgi:multiple sugar transport system permease protein
VKKILLFPAILFFGIFVAWPLVEVIILSFYKTNYMKSIFVGFDNYITIFKSKDFILSIFNSLFYASILVPGQIILSLFLSFFIMDMGKGWQDISRILFYVPILSAGIIIAQVWKWIFQIDGPVNWILSLMNIDKVNWFGQGITSIPAISLIVLFSSFGGNILLFLASILSIDKEIIEAAKIDGANSFIIRMKIILPMIKNTIILVGLMSMIAAFQIFETIYSLSPQTYSATMTFHIYQQGFIFSKYGLAAAEAVILIIMMSSLSILKKRFEHE